MAHISLLLNVGKELMTSFSPVEVVDVVGRWWLWETHSSLPDVLAAVDGLNVLSGVLEKKSSFTATAGDRGVTVALRPSAAEVWVSSQALLTLHSCSSRRPKQTFEEQQQLYLFQTSWLTNFRQCIPCLPTTVTTGCCQAAFNVDERAAVLRFTPKSQAINGQLKDCN